MLKFLKERVDDYNANSFINELFEASKYLGILEAKISGYHFDQILIPLLHKREAQSTMYIEGTQTTISDVFEDEIRTQPNNDKVITEFNNHTRSIMYGSEYLRSNPFSHSFIKNLHKQIMDGVVSHDKQKTLGRYKTQDNKIVNSAGTLIFTPPPYTETKKYMDELIAYMNNTNDGINPLIKAAIIHSQFESIHPFEDGNGRVGRLLISLYLFKAKVINCPFFYMSEAISQDKRVYYNMLTASRTGSFDDWINFFLKKCVVQAHIHINYIDSLNDLYKKTKQVLQKVINTPKFDQILECLFTHPVLTSTYLANELSVTVGQAKRYLDVLESNQILRGNDRKRNKAYYFVDLLDLVRRT
ncbi:MAG: Fic family protein [Agathobacter sp.]